MPAPIIGEYQIASMVTDHPKPKSGVECSADLEVAARNNRGGAVGLTHLSLTLGDDHCTRFGRQAGASVPSGARRCDGLLAGACAAIVQTIGRVQSSMARRNRGSPHAPTHQRSPPPRLTRPGSGPGIWRWRRSAQRPRAASIDRRSPQRMRARVRFWRVGRKRADMPVSSDLIGNLFVRRAGTEPGAHPILTGSHIDTQPTGGRFDGIYGVLAGFEVLQALDDAGLQTRRPIELSPGPTRRATASNRRARLGCLRRRLPAGRNAGGARRRRDQRRRGCRGHRCGVRRLPIAGNQAFRSTATSRPTSSRGLGLRRPPTIGVVTGIQGHRRYSVEVLGEAAHSAATPRSAR